MERTYTLEELDDVAEMVLNQTSSKIILFHAPMGAGKTTLIKSICKKLGVKSEITSPTFSLVNEYKGDLVDIYHFDLYRIENNEQLFDIGFDDYLEKDAFCLIEWPEYSLSFLSEYQSIVIDIVNSSKRKIKIM